MSEQGPQIAIRLAYVGQPGVGKTASIEKFHRTLEPERRRELISINSSDGTSLLFDYFPFELQFEPVKGQSMALQVELYALPGAPRLELARRIVAPGIDGFIFTCDGRDERLDETLLGMRRVDELLQSTGRTLKTAAVVAQVNKRDLVEGNAGARTEAAVRGFFGDRVVLASARTGEAISDVVRRAAALALRVERDAIEARKAGAPPMRVETPPDLEEDIALAYRLYLRSFNGRDALDSPHSELFFGRVLLEIGAVAESELEDAMRVRAQAIDLALGVSLEDVLKKKEKKEVVDPDRLIRAHRIRAAAEVIHEELLFGKIASELDLVPFQRVKKALLVQTRRAFMHSLNHLLARAGQLSLEATHKVYARLLQVHQGELQRERKELKSKKPIAKRVQETRRVRPLFGTIALKHGFITEQQLDECLKEQRDLAARGEHRFLGVLLQRKGYLGEEEVTVICKALEEEIANDHIEGYRIIAPLGRGAMALVFAAKQLNLERVVALKVLDPKLLFETDFIDRFMSEARAAARLNHPNIVQAYDVGTSKGYHYFAMEYVEGATLRDFQEECGGRLEETLAVYLVREVARALTHAEAHRLVHRDIKPGNIMIARTGVVKLCDLGLAQRMDVREGGKKDEGVILGSPYYISPEQIEGVGDLDSRADVYSLGATLFHLLTGRPPFVGRTPEDVCLQHLSEPVPDPRTLNPLVTQRIVPVIYRMMHKDRAHRFPTTGEAVAELNKLLPTDTTEDQRHEDLARRVRERFPKRGVSA